MLKKYITKEAISILESLYLLYMFYYFKTRITFNHPMEFRIHGSYFEHPIGSSEYENKICDFGRDAILVLVAYLIARNYLDLPKILNPVVVGIVFVMSFKLVKCRLST